MEKLIMIKKSGKIKNKWKKSGKCSQVSNSKLLSCPHTLVSNYQQMLTSLQF